ncbi:MAG: cupredoxin domain-containing protein, partial [Actinomycetota bacterium]
FFRCDLHPTHMTGQVVVEEKGAGGQAGGEATQVALRAKDLAFDRKELILPAPEAVIRLRNSDTVPHNFSIYNGEDASKALFQGKVINGGENIDNRVDLPGPGEYFFRCDLHPTLMTGQVVVEEKGAGDQAGGEATQVALRAKDLVFDVAELDLAAGTDVVVRLRNDDTVPHNLAIFAGEHATDKKFFTGAIFSGPATKEYRFKAPPAGAYHFHCDVHPNMQGKVVVR